MFRVASSLVICCIVPTAIYADDEASAIVEKAIVAHSGKGGKLERLRTATVTLKGTVFTPAGELSATRKMIVDWPRKTRFDWSVARGDGDVRMTIVVDGEKGWQKISGMTASDASSEEMEVYTADVHALRAASILPLKEKGFTLSLLSETTINDSPVVGVKAAYRNRPDVALYFDKKSGLLVRTAFKGKEAGAEVVKESTYTDYKDADGLMVPGKQVDTADRRKTFEWKTTTYEFPEKIPAESFAKP